MTVQESTFRDLFANWPSGVSVITCQGTDGRPQGFTASSLVSVSLAPPLVLFVLKRDARSMAHFLAAEGFGVNTLGIGAEEISTRFATPDVDRFSELAYTAGEHTGAPLLQDAWGRMECRMRHQYDGGDHVIFVGEVLSIEAEAAEPLVYHKRGYRRLADAE